MERPPFSKKVRVWWLSVSQKRCPQYCKFGAPHRKPTTIWTNCKGLIDAAAPGLWFCGGAYKCRNWHNHVRVEGADASESSEFPEAFCTWMGAHINTEADRRAALRDN